MKIKIQFFMNQYVRGHQPQSLEEAVGLGRPSYNCSVRPE